MRVFVTGASGYVGHPLVQHLLTQGHHVMALVRPGSKRPLAERTNFQVAHGDVFDEAGMSAAMVGCDAVIHLVGIIREHASQGVTMQRMHVEATSAVLRAAKGAGVSRFVHMSALGARRHALSSYHVSKWQAEEQVRASGLPYVIFRPSVIFGSGGPGPNFVRQLQDLVRLPVCPLLGDGQSPFQPVSVMTVVDAMEQALHGAVPVGSTYEMGGPQVLSYRQILDKIAAAQGRRVRFVRVPMRLLELTVPWLQAIPAFPLTRDQLIMLKEGNVCHDGEAVYRDFQLAPIPFPMDDRAATS